MPPELPPPELPPEPPLLPEEPLLPPRERELLLRERELLPRELELLAREDLAPPVERFEAVDLLPAADLRAPDERLAPELDDLARDEDFFAPPLDRLAPEARELPDELLLLERLALDEDEPDDLRPPLDRDEDEDDEEPEPVAAAARSVGDHLPDITR